MNTNTLRSQLHSTTDEIFFSYEWTPAFSNEKQTVLDQHISDVAEKGAPFFMAVSWHLRGNFSVENLPSLSLVADLLKLGHKNVVLHVCAYKLKKENVLKILNLAKENGIRNIVALRGDRSSDTSTCDFPYAINLVKYIREHFGDYFTIGVAGYPGGHPDCISKDADIQYLKEKVDAGADFVLTQIVFDSAEFIEFVKRCQSVSINVPVIPGIMPIQSYHSVVRMAALCNVNLPNSILNDIEQIKDDDQAVMKYGIEKAVQIIEDILRADINVKKIHIFTCNKSYPAITVYEEVMNNISASSS